jgi:hypothetical protein
MHALELMQCTGDGRGMPTIASTESEGGGVLNPGMKRERRTRYGGCVAGPGEPDLERGAAGVAAS